MRIENALDEEKISAQQPENFLFKTHWLILCKFMSSEIVIAKQELFKALETLPATMSVQQILGVIEILKILKIGQYQIENGQYLTHEEVEKRVGLWQQK